MKNRGQESKIIEEEAKLCAKHLPSPAHDLLSNEGFPTRPMYRYLEQILHGALPIHAQEIYYIHRR